MLFAGILTICDDIVGTYWEMLETKTMQRFQQSIAPKLGQRNLHKSSLKSRKLTRLTRSGTKTTLTTELKRLWSRVRVRWRRPHEGRLQNHLVESVWALLYLIRRRRQSRAKSRRRKQLLKCQTQEASTIPRSSMEIYLQSCLKCWTLCQLKLQRWSNRSGQLWSLSLYTC